MKKMSIKKLMALALFLIISPLTYAQTGFEDDVDDEPAPQAPINSLVIVGFAAGTLLAYKVAERQKEQK